MTILKIYLLNYCNKIYDDRQKNNSNTHELELNKYKKQNSTTMMMHKTERYILADPF